MYKKTLFFFSGNKIAQPLIREDHSNPKIRLKGTQEIPLIEAYESP